MGAGSWLSGIHGIAGLVVQELCGARQIRANWCLSQFMTA